MSFDVESRGKAGIKLQLDITLRLISVLLQLPFRLDNW